MRLYLLRHGQAEPYQAQDEIRQLTETGRLQTAEIARQYLANVRWDAIWASPYIRAQQTAQIVLDAVHQAQPDRNMQITTVSRITPEDSAREALALFNGHEGRTLLLVSHQPFLGTLAGLLIHGHMQTALDIPTSGLLELHLSIPGMGQAELIKVVAPA